MTKKLIYSLLLAVSPVLMGISDYTTIMSDTTKQTDIVIISEKVTYKPSDVLLSFLMAQESYSDTVYSCASGKPTIGYGHRIKKGESFSRLTKEEAINLLISDVMDAYNLIDRLHPNLPTEKKEALASFIFNIGSTAYINSSVKRSIDLGAENIEVLLMKWCKGTINGEKVVLKGLEKRRQFEIELWNREG